MYTMTSSLVFCETPECADKWVFDSCAFSWALFLQFVCLVQLPGDSFYFYLIVVFVIFFIFLNERMHDNRATGVKLTYLEMENQFFLIKSHWIYHPFQVWSHVQE